MKPRKTLEIAKSLKKKGFQLDPEKDHHQYYVFCMEGKKTSINTYFSHNKSEYDSGLLSSIKRSLFFPTTTQFEEFLDCPLSKEKYIEILRAQGKIK